MKGNPKKALRRKCNFYEEENLKEMKLTRKTEYHGWLRSRIIFTILSKKIFKKCGLN